MTDLIRLETALRNADAAGDTEAATKIAQAIRSARSQEQPQSPGMSFKDTADDYANSLSSGLTKGTIGLAGAPGDVRELGIAGRDALLPNAEANREKYGWFNNLAPSFDWLPTSEELTPEGVDYQPKTTAGKYIQTTAEIAPAMIAGPGGVARKGIATALTGGATEGAGQLTGDNPYAKAGAGLVTALMTGGRGAKFEAPTTAEREAVKTRAYAVAEADKTQIPSASVSEIIDRVGNAAVDAGMDPDLSRDAYVALKKFIAREGPMTPDDLDKARQVLKMGGGSLNANDRRVTKAMIIELDKAADELAPGAFGEARRANKDFKRSEMVDELNEGIDLKQTQYSQSGLDNAIRTEYRQLARNKGKMRQFDKETKNAVRATAGVGETKVEQAARWASKFAPTSAVNVIPSILSSGGMAIPGMIGKVYATASTKEKKRIAEALIKGVSTQYENAKKDRRYQSLVRALLSGEAAGTQLRE